MLFLALPASKIQGVKWKIDLPARKVGAAVAWLFGQDPSQTIGQDLRRFKRIMEGDEVPTTAPTL